ncbi:AzlC family ABC transporter permease [Salimicrobium sp. PL1-032A]|uniref:AzlC family ABC transporter permease n=1 Tax=Salimicrobium sp. PL1-032A TaxID=3095364 RepID=UPI00325FED6D
MDVYEEALHSSGKSEMFRRGLVAGSPIILGYIPIALTYGVLAYQAGLSLWELTFMSAAVFAGPLSFLACLCLLLVLLQLKSSLPCSF